MPLEDLDPLAIHARLQIANTSQRALHLLLRHREIPSMLQEV